jgi:predicted RNA-binding Zn-ribbon protein involved in translation (DUF1610 family)
MVDMRPGRPHPVNGFRDSMTTTKQVVICPYCGETQPAGERCRTCRGLFEPLSRQATHNAMGPWYIHDRTRPHQPGCSYETLAQLVERGQVTKYSIIRGPTTKQFWTVARHVPGLSHLLGYCHACDARVDAHDHGCPQCGVPFGAYLDRNHLGLPEVRPLPWEAPSVDHPADAAPAPVLTWSASTSGPRGLSSFAADEELLDTGHAPLRPDGNGASAPTAPSPSSAAAESDLVSSPVVRSMQRRLARQQRTIRRLTLLVLVVAVLSVIMVVVTAARKPGDGAAPPPSLDAAAPTGMDASDASDAAAAVGEDDPVVEPAVLDPPDDAAPAEAPSDETAPPPATAPDAAPPLDPIDALEAAAKDAARPRDDRIRDYEAALALLNEQLTRTVGELRRPIEERIARLEDELERLRLKEFFR